MSHQLYTYPAKLERVVDGDTLILEIDLGFNIRKRDYVRLYGVNTPEIFGVNASVEGADAKAYVVAWLAQWPLIIRSNKYDEREKYGRILATVYRQGDTESLNSALVREGHGI